MTNDEKIKRAKQSLVDQEGLLRRLGVFAQGKDIEDTYSPEQLSAEIEKLDAQDAKQTQLKADKEAEDAIKEEEEKAKKIDLEHKGLLKSNIAPEYLDHAYNIFPSLNEIAPRQTIPLAPENKVEEQGIAEKDLLTTKEPVAKKPEQSQAISEIQREPAAEQEMQQVVSEEPSIEDLMKQRDENLKNARLQKSFAQFRDAAIGMGLGRKFESDMEMYDAAIKGADKPLQDLLLKQELKDKKSKDDPNSPISQLTQNFLTQLGVDPSILRNVSYNQLEKSLPSLVNAMNTKIAADAKKEEAAANRIYRQTQADILSGQKADAKKEQQYKDLYGKTAKIIDSDKFKLYKNTITTNTLLDEAVANWDKAGDEYKAESMAAFMSYAKGAQQDSSVVRESDMKVLAGGVNYGSLKSLVDKFAAMTKGSRFSPSELKAFKAVMETIGNIKRKELKEALNPIMLKAEQNEVPKDLLLDSNLYDSIYNAPLSQQEQLKQIEERLKASQKRIDELNKKKGA